jgi:hypothetical protein
VARLEGDGVGDAVAAAAVVEQRLGLPAGSIAGIIKRSTGGTLTSADARAMFTGYLEAVERLTQYIDRWHGR